jgi:hypothetical protein
MARSSIESKVRVIFDPDAGIAMTVTVTPAPGSNALTGYVTVPL